MKRQVHEISLISQINCDLSKELISLIRFISELFNKTVFLRHMSLEYSKN